MGRIRSSNLALACAMAVALATASVAGLAAAADSVSPSTQGRPPRVLVLHSYYRTFTWSDRITEGIRGAFARSEFSDAALFFEYLDAKRHPEAAYLDLYANILRSKYTDDNPIDLLICSDDQALAFLLERSDSLFPGVPLVFCAVNGYREQMRSAGRPLTGVVEDIDPARTLEVALRLQPELRQVLVICDTTLTGRAIEAQARAAFAPFQDRLAFRYVGDLSMAQLQREVAALQADAIVFLFVFNRDNLGRDYGHEESLQQIASHCRVPIYGPWTFYLGHGIVGGMLTSGRLQGIAAAGLAFRVLRGEPAQTIPVELESPNRFMFDHRQLVRHRLPMDRLPAGSEVINRSESFFQKYRLRIWAAVLALALEALIIGLLLRNIVRRRAAEQELRDSERRYRGLIETVRDLVFIIGTDGKLNYLNPEFEQITGYPVEEFLGCPFTELLSPVYVKATVDRFLRGLSGEEVPVFEVEVKHKDRGSTPIELKVTALIDVDGKTRGLIGVARDICERMQAEEEKIRLESELQRAQKMEAIGTLAGGVAHDLNNILSGIVSYPDLLLMQLPEESPLRKPMRTIRDSGQKAAAIVQDLLTLARRGIVTTGVLNLNDVVSDYLASPEHAKLKSFHPRVRVEFRAQPGLLNIMGSPFHVSKVLMNLVSNAAEAMAQGGTVLIETENRYVDQPISGYDRVKEGDYVLLRVTDTGVGIAPQDRQRIFEPFYSKKVMGRSGTGLGMAVVWGTMKDLDGYIDLQSTEGEGTTFTLYFPATRKPLENKTQESVPEAQRANGETILVVDDVKAQREIASMMLSQLGYETHSVAGGREAVEYVRGHHVDLVLLDMIMHPQMDGLDTYREIAVIRPGQKAVIASGFSENERVKEAQRLGAGPYLKKPYTMEKLAVTVRSELDRAPQDKQRR